MSALTNRRTETSTELQKLLPLGTGGPESQLNKCALRYDASMTLVSSGTVGVESATKPGRKAGSLPYGAGQAHTPSAVSIVGVTQGEQMPSATKWGLSEKRWI